MPTDAEIIDAMAELDDDDDISIDYAEAGLMNTIIEKKKRGEKTLSVRQREWALGILEKYGREI